MKRYPLIFFLLLSLPTLSLAEWAWIPLQDLVCDSDLIVVGTLSSVNEYTKEGMDYGQGMITVEEPIWGAVNFGEALTLKWANGSNVICPRVEHRQNADKKGIWLLKLSPDGAVRADYPGRFVELDRQEKVTKILARKNVCVRIARYSVSGAEPVTVELVFRNPTQGEMRFPGLEYQDGRLFIDPDVTLTLRDGFRYCCSEIDRLPDRVFVSDNVAPIVVGPNQERRITLDLRQVFDLNADGPYTFRFKVKGFELGNDCEFYMGPTEHPVGNDSDEPKNSEVKTTPVYKTQLALWLALGIIGAIGSFSFYRRLGRK
jgi:hypothetical protein